MKHRGERIKETNSEKLKSNRDVKYHDKRNRRTK